MADVCSGLKNCSSSSSESLESVSDCAEVPGLGEEGLGVVSSISTAGEFHFLEGGESESDRFLLFDTIISDCRDCTPLARVL